MIVKNFLPIQNSNFRRVIFLWVRTPEKKAKLAMSLDANITVCTSNKLYCIFQNAFNITAGSKKCQSLMGESEEKKHIFKAFVFH